MDIREVEIPVPWGHVSAKIWGSEDKPPILCFHGVMDNAGTFNRLIPLLPPHYRYICIDLPGHGRSSHFPAHLPIYTLNYIPVYTIIMNYFGKESYIVLGHSYGGQIAFLYARLYPTRIQKLIMLDTVHLFPVSSKHFGYYLTEKFSDYFNIQEKLEKNSQPTYTYEEVLNRIRKRRNGNVLTVEAAENLLERSIEQTIDGKYKFTLDQRLKNFINPVHDFRYILDNLKEFNIECPVIMILGKDSRDQQMYMKPLLKVFHKKKNIIIKQVLGDHDVHNSSPEEVAPHIIKFLSKSKL